MKTPWEYLAARRESSKTSWASRGPLGSLGSEQVKYPTSKPALDQKEGRLQSENWAVVVVVVAFVVVLLLFVLRE